MIWFMVFQVVSMLIELVQLGRQSERAKDLEILLLRRQLAIYERRQERCGGNLLDLPVILPIRQRIGSHDASL